MYLYSMTIPYYNHYDENFLNHIIEIRLYHVHPNSLIIVILLATKVYPINVRHVDTTNLLIPKLVLILIIYVKECDRREGDNKGHSVFIFDFLPCDYNLGEVPHLLNLDY